MATRADVARLAGVSPSTVSYVLNGQRSVKPETKKRVQAAVKQLNYVPNLKASNLAARSLRTVGLHLFAETNGIDLICASYICGMRQYASENDTSLVIPILHKPTRKEFARFLRSSGVDALIFMEASINDWREEVLLELDFPGVILGTTGRKEGLPYVESDFEAIGSMAVDVAAEAGHRRALVIVRKENRSDLERTIATLMQGLRVRAELRGVRLDVLAVPAHSSQAVHAMKFFEGEDPPTIIIGENAEVTTATVTLANSRGIRLGPNFSVVTLAAKVPYGAMADCLFTEITTDRIAMGYACMEKVTALYYRHQRNEVESRVFPPFLIDRKTVFMRS
ncbi:MAG: LacI family DNA-binding transcriptional regulator [Actinomycetaceae bacterium]|nr:LacI family DNA-binding transcriptional regulator [Actinomycetaceae bacterium]